MITLEVKVILSLNNKVFDCILWMYKHTNVEDFLNGIKSESERDC